MSIHEMTETTKAEFMAAFRAKFGFGEMTASASADAHAMLNAAAWAWQASRKDRTDWQAECLKRGFEYVRESDDHYVLADVPEMADLLGALLGVEVRDRENDGYGDTVSNLTSQVDAGIDAFHRAYEAEKACALLKVELEELAAKHAECAEFIDQACLDAAPLEAVDGDQLPPIGSKVLIHLGSSDVWVEHTVAGYYVWGDLGGNESLSRVFVRVRDEAGFLNARLLKDVKPIVASVLGPVVSVPKELIHE